MYAIVDTGGKQYRVSEGEVINVEKLNSEVGSEVVLDKVLLVNSQDQIKLGDPFLADGKIRCEVLEHNKDKKVVIFKHKKRKDYRKKAGHRQPYTKLRIQSIEV